MDEIQTHLLRSLQALSQRFEEEQKRQEEVSIALSKQVQSAAAHDRALSEKLNILAKNQKILNTQLRNLTKDMANLAEKLKSLNSVLLQLLK